MHFGWMFGIKKVAVNFQPDQWTPNGAESTLECYMARMVVRYSILLKTVTQSSKTVRKTLGTDHGLEKWVFLEGYEWELQIFRLH